MRRSNGSESSRGNVTAPKDTYISVMAGPTRRFTAAQFAVFTAKEAMSAAYAFAIFASLAVSKLVHIPGLPRYDLIFLLCVAVQVAMIMLHMESLDELKMICLFHFLGLGLEMFKVAHGSWSYPEPAYLKVANTPLYSGFMYSSVGSYISQAFRHFDLKITHSPPHWASMSLAAAIYLNFFTNHWLPDARWLLIPAVLLIYAKTTVDFECKRERFRMPLSLSFFCMGFFIWIAENIVTRLQGYRYPYQAGAWTLVHGSKIGSWFLLVILSYIAVEWAQERLPKSIVSPESLNDATQPIGRTGR